MIRFLGRTLSGRILIAGVGRVDRRDDGAGRVLARRLASAPGVQTLDCGDRLEDFTGDIVRLRPDIVLIADAVDMRVAPGSIALFEAGALPEALNSHAATLRPAMEYLKLRTRGDVLLLAIQPAHVADGVGLSPEVGATVGLLVDLFAL